MKNKLLLVLSVTFIFLAPCSSNANYSSCSGTQVSSCGSLSTSNCSGHYIPPKNANRCNDGDAEECGIYCTTSGSTCSDGGAFCS